MQPSDYDTVTQLIQALYLEDPEGKPISREKIDLTCETLDSHPDLGTIIVFEYNNAIVGYAILINFWSNEFGGNILNIDELYIESDFRSQGIGTEFIKHLQKNTFANAVALQLEVSNDNSKAHALYKRLGFTPTKNSVLTLELQ